MQIQHTYRPVVGGSAIYESDSGETSVNPYCGGKEVLQEIARQKKLPAPKDPNTARFLEKTIDYILTTANNWAGPIRSFRLAVITDNPDDIALTCMPGLKRAAPTRYELTRSDFRPDQDLKLLILQRVR